MIIIKNNSKFTLLQYISEEEFEKDILANAKSFFGKNIIYIESKKKIDTKDLGGSVPDGFLFDLSDGDNPDFYLVEIELSSHDFFKHIFPQITKFFAFFKSSKNRAKLVEKIFSIVNTNSSLKREFKKYLGEKEIYKFIKDVIDDSQNILLIIDGEKKEIPEITETYTDTWGKIVKLLTIRKFSNKKDFIFVLDPEFERIEYGPEESSDEDETDYYTEEFHLDGVDELVKKAFFEIKNRLLKVNSDIQINPQKYYISIRYGKNIAYFKFRKKKIRLVVMLPEAQIREKIKNHKVHSLSEAVQRYYNGSCGEIIIENLENIEEVIALLKSLI